MTQKIKAIILLAAGFFSLGCQQAFSMDSSTDSRFLEKFAERRAAVGGNEDEGSHKDLYVRGAGSSISGAVGDRSYELYVPPHAVSNMPLLVVLHGGMGNAKQIQEYIGLEPYADKYGFLIAYMNGSPVTKVLSAKRAGWNAGDCCGQPQEKNVNDVAFISNAIKQITSKYNIDIQRIYGTGHSNGAMMTYRMLCETNLYQGAAIYSGTLAIDIDRCPMAAGKPILALHGAKDKNLPPEGGHTKSGLNKKTNYRSQDYTISVFKNSGANYTHIMLPNAAHKPETINADLLAIEGVSLPQKIVSFLHLDNMPD